MLRIRRAFSWKLSSSAPHPDFQLQSALYHHSTLKTPLLHLRGRDPHKACVIVFRTTPENDKGAPHCLERLVLCGSKRYPVRDPFLHMRSRSLNTFTDAWTGADFTAYPFSTVNAQDFRHLLRVYLDSVLFPLLRDVDFKHEAVRLEMGDKGLRFTGRVYDEMKSQLSQSDSYFMHQLTRHMFPGTAYQFNAGGEPEALTTLTSVELKEFHARFYHPSNATILMYGDIDTEGSLELIESEFFKHFEYREVRSEVPDVKRFEAPLTLKLPCYPQATDTQNATIFGLSYLCDPPFKDPYTSFCLSVLSAALFSSPKSPLFTALLGSGLAREYLSGSGYDTSTREATFTVGVSGCAKAEVGNIEKAIMKTLQQVVDSGIDSALVDSAIHQMEIQHKEVRSDFGLSLLSSLLPYSLHSGNFLFPLHINSHLDRLRTELAQGKPVFQSIAKRYLWDNPHKVILEMTPDVQFQKDKLAKEKKRLQSIAAELDIASTALIVQEAEDIRQTYSGIQNIDVLPTVALEDIAKEMETVQYAKSIDVDGVQVHFVAQPTNGITYLKVRADVTELPVDLRDILPLYTRLFNELGTKSNAFEEFEARKAEFTTSGLQCELVVSSLKDSIESHKEVVTFTVGFLERNTDQVFDLLTEALTQLDFASHTQLSFAIQKLVKQQTDLMRNNYVEYAVSLACSSLTPAGNSYESLRTVSSRQLKHDSSLAAQLLQALSSSPVLSAIERRLKQVHRHVFNRSNLQLLIHTSDVSATEEKVVDRIDMLSNALRLDIDSYTSPVQKLPVEAFNKFIYQAYLVVPGSLNYVVESFLSVAFAHPDYAVLSIVSELLAGKFLLREVKEVGGAVSAGVICDPHKATFSLYSYRDPSNLRTYFAFEKAVTKCAEGGFEYFPRSARDLEQAKLRAFAKVDRPTAVYDKGLPLFLYGISDHLRQEHRVRMLKTTADDVKRVATEYLLTPISKGLTSKVVFGTEEVEKDELRKMGWMVARPIDALS